MRKLNPDGTWNNKQREGRQYSIDLETGRWSLWGVGTWHAFEELPGARSGAEFDAELTAAPQPAQPPAAEASIIAAHPYVAACIAAGFVPRSAELSVYGNVMADRDGDRFLITTIPPGIVDSRFDNRALDEFGGRAPESRPAPKPRPRLEDVVFDPTPVVTSGRSRQVSLF